MGRKRRTTPKLEWSNEQEGTADGRFVYQVSHIRGEGVWYDLWIQREEDLSTARLADVSLCTTSLAKLKALAQRIADWTDGVYPLPKS